MKHESYESIRERFALESIQGWMDRCDMIWLYDKACTMKNQKIVEIGCWKGRSTGAILAGLEEGNEMYCVDVWNDEVATHEEYRNPENAFDTFQKHTSKFLVNPEIIRKPSTEAYKCFEDGSLDWVFIDGDHSVEEVLRDIVNWSKKIRKGGVISGHDWQFETVKEAIKKSGIKLSGNTTHKNISGYYVGSIWWAKC